MTRLILNQHELVALPDQMEYNITRNWFDFADLQSESIAQAVMEEIEMHLAVYGECDPPDQANYMSGPNYDHSLVMWCITGDSDWLPDHRDDNHYDQP